MPAPSVWRPARRAAFACFALLAATAASAHDTWLERAPAGTGTDAVFLLGTATRFPRHENPVDPRYFVRSGCLDASGAERVLEPLRLARRQTMLRSAPLDPKQFGCWLQLQPFEIDLQPEIVQVYLDEIAASPALREAWQRLRAAGRPFEERYVKVARIEGVTAPVRATPLAPALPIDLQRVAPAQPLRSGTEAVFELRRDGQPLAGLPIELLHEAAATGRWLRSDERGRFTAPLTQPGRWLLRGVDLRPPADERSRWESRFIAYTFDVAP